MVRSVETDPAHPRGCEERKIPAGGEIFSCLMSDAIVTGFYLWQRNFTA